MIDLRHRDGSILAGLVLLSRDTVWDRVIEREALRDWALDALAAYVVPGDNAPATLLRRPTCRVGFVGAAG